MVKIGYGLSSEEQSSRELVRTAVMAEEAGFTFAAISDHYHPWLDRQGQSPFVWSVLGAIANATGRLQIGTGVTCPIKRVHPAIVAQAAATVADLMPGRFFLGLGTGENLNEHVVGGPWPSPVQRIDMLDEAVEIIRLLWEGEYVNYDGAYFVVENARVYTLPEVLPPIFLAAAGPTAARLAGSKGDGLISMSPQRELVDAFRGEGNDGPRLGELAVCYQESEEAGMRVATELWPISALGGAFMQELPLPQHFAEVTSLVKPDDVAKSVVCSTDPKDHIAAIQEYAAAGFDHVIVHQIGPNQDWFFDFYRREVVPHFGRQDGASLTAGGSTSRRNGGNGRARRGDGIDRAQDRAGANASVEAGVRSPTPVRPPIPEEEATGPEAPPRMP